MYLTYHPEISFKKGVFFFPLFLWTPEKFKKGVIKYLCLLYLKIIKNLIKSWAQIPEIPASFEQCSGFRGVSCLKPVKSPQKGVFRNVGCPEIGGCFQREGTSIHVP